MSGETVAKVRIEDEQFGRLMTDEMDREEGLRSARAVDMVDRNLIFKKSIGVVCERGEATAKLGWMENNCTVYMY